MNDITAKVFAGVERMIAAAGQSWIATVQQKIDAAVAEIPEGPSGPAGEQGVKGAPGERGSDGSPGRGGSPGPQGEKGLVGPQGERGLEGVAGRDGRDALPMPGPAGEKGIDGRDGKDGITEDRLLSAVAQMKKELRAEIVKSIRLNGRKLLVDGEVLGVLAVPLYRDVFKAGETYEPGDMATFGGSCWHANRPTSEKPGVNDDWTLAVKHGRDAR